MKLSEWSAFAHGPSVPEELAQLRAVLESLEHRLDVLECARDTSREIELDLRRALEVVETMSAEARALREYSRQISGIRSRLAEDMGRCRRLEDLAGLLRDEIAEMRSEEAS